METKMRIKKDENGKKIVQSRKNGKWYSLKKVIACQVFKVVLLLICVGMFIYLIMDPKATNVIDFLLIMLEKALIAIPIMVFCCIGIGKISESF